MYDRVPETLERLDWALEKYYPDVKFTTPPFFRFGSWIGGDRDGNPFVNNTITREALVLNRQAVLRHYQGRLNSLFSQLSVSIHAIRPPAEFVKHMDRLLDESGRRNSLEKRNPGEIFRQYVICLLEKIRNTEKKNTLSEFSYADADQFIRDLKILEQGLEGADCAHLASSRVTPLLRQDEAFRFCTACLDIRENSTVVTKTLGDIWQLQHQGETAPPAHAPEWLAWIQEELSTPADELPNIALADRQSAMTFGLFQMIAETRRTLDRQAIGGFILSMTRSVADVLGVYLLAKYAGVFSDSLAGEISPLPLIPLFEDHRDLRNGPVMQKGVQTPVVRRRSGNRAEIQEVMIGYSDFEKDGGF